MEDNKELYSSMPLLLFYEDKNGGEQKYPTDTAQIRLVSYQYTAERMGGAPNITASFFHTASIENEMWDKRVYTKFRGERYYLKNIPSITKDNTNVLTKHDVTFVSERFVLDNILFYDVVDKNGADGKYVSNTTSFNFYGNVEQLAKRLNAAFAYAKVDYIIVLDDKLPQTEDKLVNVDNTYLSTIIQEFYKTFEIPYYFVGKTIHVGYYEDKVGGDDYTFKYGSSNALLSISKSTNDTKVITRCTGIGSTDNIPYFYPNQTELGFVDFEIDRNYPNATDAEVKIQNVYRFNQLSDNDIFRYEFFPDTKIKRQLSYSQTWSEPIVRPEASDDVPSGRPNTQGPQQRAREYGISSLFIIPLAANSAEPTFEIKKLTNRVVSIAEISLYYINDSFYNVMKNRSFGTTEKTQIFSAPLEGDTYTFKRRLGELTGTGGGYVLVVGYTSELETHINPNLWADEAVWVGDAAGPIWSIRKYELIDAEKNSGWYLYKNEQGERPLPLDEKTDLSKKQGTYCDIENYGLHYTVDLDNIDKSKNGAHAEFKIVVTKKIPYQPSLSPSIYRNTNGEERFYDAKNGDYGELYEDIYVKSESENGEKEYYVFDTPYNEVNRVEHIETFEDIRPTIKEATNADGLRIDEFIAFDYDDFDNDKLEVKGDELENKHSYFYAKLRKTDGPNGFNLFDQASEKGEMTISMTTGNCGACNFVIVVDPDTQKNMLLVDENGNIKKDPKTGDAVFGDPQPQQNDTRNNEVWLALKKEKDTYGVVMPNAEYNYKPKAASEGVEGDHFVIVNMAMPEAYVTAAEDKLDREIIKFMWENNVQVFDFTIKLSRVFLANNSNILRTLTENALLKVAYPDDATKWDLYVSNFTYKVDANSPLPEITVTVSKKLGGGGNSIQQAISNVERNITERINSLPTNNTIHASYISKKDDEKIDGEKVFNDKIIANKGIDFGVDYDGNGAKVYKNSEGLWCQDIDCLNVRSKVNFYEVEVLSAQHIGGAMISSAASCKLNLVVNKYDDNGQLAYYRCYFKKSNAGGFVVNNDWEIDDQAYCAVFNTKEVGELENSNDRAWWRRVISTSDNINTSETNLIDTDGFETINVQDYHFIDISALNDSDNCAVGLTEDFPKKGDNVILLGNRNPKADPSRTNAIVQSACGDGAPYYKQFKGIVDFVLPEPNTLLSPEKNRLTGVLSIEEGSMGARHLTDLPDTILESVKIGGENLLLNTAFTGSYTSKQMGGSTLESSTEVFSQAFEHWSGNIYERLENTNNPNAYYAKIGVLSQDVTLVKDDEHILSFNIKGSVQVLYDHEVVANITSPIMKRHNVSLAGNGLLSTISFMGQGDCVIGEIKLERGNVPTDWLPSKKDNDRAYGEIAALNYISEAIRDGRTKILGGLLLTSLIKVGKYRNKIMESITAGLSGIYNDNDDVAFWGGGTLEQAINAVQLFKNNPLYEPTEDELANIANSVITHGGRAILNDVVARGTIYADKGVFRGDVAANNVISRGAIRNEMTVITPENINLYATYNGSNYLLDFDKTGYLIRFEGVFDNVSFLWLKLPNIAYESTLSHNDKIRGIVEKTITIYNFARTTILDEETPLKLRIQYLGGTTYPLSNLYEDIEGQKVVLIQGSLNVYAVGATGTQEYRDFISYSFNQKQISKKF